MYKIYSFITPLDIPIQIENLSKFCRDNDLNYQAMAHVHSGIQHSHKGWYKTVKPSEPKNYLFFNPQGVPSVTKNLSGFCRDNDLNYHAMLELNNGKRKSHKGWYKTAENKPSDGKKYQFFNSQGVPAITKKLPKFCRDNNLSYHAMLELHNGKRKSHKGWYKTIENKPSDGKKYQFFNPAQELVVIENLSKFCRDNDLNYQSMLKINSGKQRSHKGWYRLPCLTW